MSDQNKQLTEEDVNSLIEAKLTNLTYLGGPIRLIRGYIQSNNFEDGVNGTTGWYLGADGTYNGFNDFSTGTVSFSSTTTTTITCGFQANYILVFATGANPTNGALQTSMGSSNGTLNKSTYTTADSGTGSISGIDGSNAWVIGYASSIASNQSGIVNNITATTFDLVNTFTNGGNTPVANLVWVAIK